MIRFKKKLVSKVKEIREELNIPQLKLAEKAGVSRQTIYFLERGESNPSLALSLKIAQIFNKPIEEIFYFCPVIREVIKGTTIGEMERIANKVNMNFKKIRKLLDVGDEQLSEQYSKNDLEKIAGALGYEFDDLFIEDEIM
ncbi:MAG: helix-turn-helix domain-containing protein [Candidatus Lokiarchaeota archaeon]|nr:helix-turn-helix domain-containing protein [Candidatus Lokiarchaeota archaeon]MBD3342197.1 helix-turn-helix domain-containing protein [Candidatus Lokiarchaeota archaeon]